MKKFKICLLPLLATNALALDIDITEAVRSNPDANRAASQLSLGNSSSGEVASAHFLADDDGQNGRIEARIRLHNKHQQCITVIGRNCWDTYNYWVNVRITAFVEDCTIGAVVASSENALYQIPAAFSTIAWNGYFGTAFNTLNICNH